MTRPPDTGGWWGLLVPLLVVALCCGGAMYTTGADTRCATQGGQLRFAFALPLGYQCVRDGQVIEP